MMESGVCSRNEGMAATGLDGTSIQFSCAESTCIVSMYRIDTIPLLHASAATTRGRGDFYLTVWHVVDCFLCVSCQIQTEKTTSPSKNLILSYSHIRKLYILTEKVDRGSSRGAPSSSKVSPRSLSFRWWSGSIRAAGTPAASRGRGPPRAPRRAAGPPVMANNGR